MNLLLMFEQNGSPKQMRPPSKSQTFSFLGVPHRFVIVLSVALLHFGALLAPFWSLWAPFGAECWSLFNPFFFLFINILPFDTRSSKQQQNTRVERIVHSKATCGTLPKVSYAPTPELKIIATSQVVCIGLKFLSRSAKTFLGYPASRLSASLSH